MSTSWAKEEMEILDMLPAPRRRRPTSQRIPVAPLLVEGLLMDYFGVIVDPSPWQVWLFQLVTRMGLHAHFQTFHKVWKSEYLEDVTLGRREYWEALESFLLASGLSRNQTVEVLAAGRAKKPQLEEAALPLPGVANTLTQLANRGLKLGLIGNVPIDRNELLQRIERMRLGRRFDAVVSIQEFKSCPDRQSRIRKAAEALERGPTRLAVVSCDRQQLAAATSIGASTIALNYDSDAQADVYLDQFGHLLNVIQSAGLQRLAS